MPTGVYKRSQSHIDKLRTVMTGRDITWGNKISSTLKKRGIKPPSFGGHKHSLETKIRIGEKSKGRNSGEKSNLWRGGITMIPNYHRDRSKTYRENNRDRVYFNNKRYSFRRRNADGYFTYDEWENLKAQYNWTCPCCEKREPEITLTIDHIIPLSMGGSSNIENIQPLCQSCNSKKGVRVITY